MTDWHQLRQMRQDAHRLAETARILGVPTDQVPERVTALQQRLADIEAELERSHDAPP